MDSLKAYTALESAILTGELKPRERLVEQELAARLGMSRTPIREALRRLEERGGQDTWRSLDELAGKRGTFGAVGTPDRGALVLEPEFIVADEPVSMLDVSIRAGVMNLMLELRKKYGIAMDEEEVAPLELAAPSADLAGGKTYELHELTLEDETGHVNVVSSGFEAEKEYYPVQFPIADGRSADELVAEIEALKKGDGLLQLYDSSRSKRAKR